MCDILPLLRPANSKASQLFLLMESICHGDLRRPLHNKELLLPALLKWADWPEEYRKDNQLAFGHHPSISSLCHSYKVGLHTFLML